MVQRIMNSTRFIQEQEYIDEYEDATFYALLSFWTNGILSLTLVAIGTIGNAAVVLSLHCGRNRKGAVKERRQAFYFYLMTFAFWNTGLLIATVLFNCIPALLKWNENLRAISNVSYLIGYLLGNCCLTANVWLAVTVTVERYLAVSLPFHSTRLTSPRRRAKLVAIILSIAAILYNSPLLFELTFNPRYALDDPNIDSYPKTTANSSELIQFSINALNGNQSLPEIIERETFTNNPPIETTASFGSHAPNGAQGAHASNDNWREFKNRGEALDRVVLENIHLLRKRRDHAETVGRDPNDYDQFAAPVYELRMSTMRDNVYYQFVYRILANMLFVSGLPFLIVLLLTVKIVCLVRESDRRRQLFRKPTSVNIDRSALINKRRSTSSSSITSRPASPTPSSTSWRHAHVVLTLIAGKFLLCYSLPVVINIFELTIDQEKYESERSAWSKALAILVDLSNLLIVLDGATNAFFYFSWWRKRTVLKKRFGRRKTAHCQNESNDPVGMDEFPGQCNEQNTVLLCKYGSAYRRKIDQRLSVCNAVAKTSSFVIRKSTLDLEKTDFCEDDAGLPLVDRGSNL